MDRITEIDNQIKKLQEEKAQIEGEAENWEANVNDCPCLKVSLPDDPPNCFCVCHEGYQVKHSLIVISVRQMVESAIISARSVTEEK
jgi:hypothetical protein